LTQLFGIPKHRSNNIATVQSGFGFRNFSLCAYCYIGLKTVPMSGVEAVKEMYLAMAPEEKRAKYKCRDNYVTLDSIQNWETYAKAEKLSTDSDEENEFAADSELNKKIAFWRGDITSLEIDAIVNAANKSLLGGGGVDGAIHSAAGKDLLDECKTLFGCETGQAKIAGGYKLPAKYVILTVGPRGEKPDQLEACYKNSFTVLFENSLRSIAFPCISTGVYGYPNLNAAHVAIKTIRKLLEANRDKVDLVVFCLFLPEDVKIYEKLLQKYFPIA